MKNVVLSAAAALLFSASVSAQSTVDSIAAKYKLIPMPEALTIEKTFPVLGSYQLNTPIAATGTISTSGTTGTTNTNTTETASASGTTAGTTDATTGTSGTMSTDASMMSTVTITLDSANKGVIWVEGLPQGKFQAHLKKSPSTYRIISQKSVDGKKTIPEGTLLFDPATQTLNIAIGKAFDDVDPAAIFAMNSAIATSTDNTAEVKVKTPTSKSKSKVSFYTATKVNAMGTATDAAATESTQQSGTTTNTTSGNTTTGNTTTNSTSTDSTQQSTPQQPSQNPQQKQ